MIELEKGKISATNLIFSIGCFIQGSTLLSAFALSIAKQDTWLTVFTGFILSMGIIGIYIALIKKYPNQTIIQMFDSVFGTFVGKFFSVIYILYFLSLASLNTRDVGNFIVGNIMPETPIIAILIMFIFICSWAVRCGVETMVRYSVIFVIIYFIVMGITLLFLIKEMDFANFLPAFTLPAMKYVQGTHVVAAIPFCEIVVFLMIAPFLDNQKKVVKSFYTGLLIGGITLLVVVVRDIATLGNMITYVTLPSYEAVRLIDIAHILTRMEVLYASELLVLQFFKISVLYYATVLGIAQVFHLRSYKPNILIVGIAIVSLSILVFDSPMENAAWGSTVAPFYNSIFVFLFPGVALLTSMIRNIIKKNKVGQT